MKQTTPQSILNHVADYFCISESVEILEQNNHAVCAIPRQIAMYLMKELLGFRINQIADTFRRNHSTVIRAIREVEKRMQVDERYRMTVEGIRESITEPEVKLA